MNKIRWSRRLSLFALLGLLALFATGCGSSAATGNSSFRQTPLVTVTSNAGKLGVSIWTAPDQPPARGMLTLKLLVQDASTRAPVDGLTFDIVPTMPAMGHGTSTVPKTEAKGNGVYIVSDVNLFMAGRWQLSMTVDGTVSDVVVAQIDVQ